MRWEIWANKTYRIIELKGTKEIIKSCPSRINHINVNRYSQFRLYLKISSAVTHSTDWQLLLSRALAVKRLQFFMSNLYLHPWNFILLVLPSGTHENKSESSSMWQHCHIEYLKTAIMSPLILLFCSLNLSRVLTILHRTWLSVFSGLTPDCQCLFKTGVCRTNVILQERPQQGRVAE